ncbi:hypothetical protein [Pseudoxanthomonas mexicana]
MGTAWEKLSQAKSPSENLGAAATLAGHALQNAGGWLWNNKGHIAASLMEQKLKSGTNISDEQRQRMQDFIDRNKKEL